MRIFGICGHSGSGKTTLIVKLLPVFAARGLKVSTIKQANAGFDVDKPGKDSYEHRAAGAREVLVASSRRWALMHEYAEEPEHDMAALVARMTPVDLLIVEGFRNWPLPRLEVHRPAHGRPLLASEDGRIVAVASDAPLPGIGLPVLPLDDTPALADFILAQVGLQGAP